ncbi:DUF1707 domain-containing protein [Nocardioides sp. Leaf307]|uniref:DUF1707 SHOCT-like domain-containing protein n=1 Tax=Nocardioides sp. Leaf307 TaxID=1736331 RepID=UPI0007032318|nr:DUF1707 domain-containing protein [Nocardioides sp. Leaf307]KQQ39423.1 hypothetical protein ASF50_15925 [Nocardioides sp. Leaf307]
MSEQHLRIGDAEREQAAAALGEHYVRGRLDHDEHAERLERVWTARTRADLGPLFADLPAQWPDGLLPATLAQRSGSGGAARDPGRWVPGRAAYWSGGRALRPRGLPAPVVAVLAVLLVLTVVTHLPLLLLGLGAWLFVHTRHRAARPQRARRPQAG